MSYLQRFSDNNVTTLTDAGTIAIDLSSGIHFQVTLGGNRTLGNPTNASAAKEIFVVVKQDATGGRTLSFDTDWLPLDSTTTVNSAANAVTLVYAVARNFGSGINWYYTVGHAGETSGGGSGAVADQIAGGTNQILNVSGTTEFVVGGFYFDPTLYYSPTVKLRLVGSFTTTSTGYVQLTLYDMGSGSAASPAAARSWVQIPYTSAGINYKVDQALTLVGSSPGTNQILSSARVYELRVQFNTGSDTSASLYLTWAGLVVT